MMASFGGLLDVRLVIFLLPALFNNVRAAEKVDDASNSNYANVPEHDEKTFVWLTSRKQNETNEMAELLSSERNFWHLSERLQGLQQQNSSIGPLKFIEVDVPTGCNSTSAIEIFRSLDVIFDAIPAPHLVRAVIGPSCAFDANSSHAQVSEANNIVQAVSWAVNARGASHIDWRIVSEYQPVDSGGQLSVSAALNFKNSFALPPTLAAQTCVVQNFLPLLKWNEFGIIYDANSTLCQPLTTAHMLNHTTVKLNAFTSISMGMNRTEFAQKVDFVLNASRIVIICAEPPPPADDESWRLLKRLFASVLLKTSSSGNTAEYVWIFVPPYPMSPQNEARLLQVFSVVNNGSSTTTANLMPSQLIVMSLLADAATANVTNLANTSISRVTLQALAKPNDTRKISQQNEYMEQSRGRWAPFAAYLGDAVTANLQNKQISSPPSPVLSLRMLANNSRGLENYGTLLCNAAFSSLPSLRLTRRLDWHTPNRQPPPAQPMCGFNPENCSIQRLIGSANVSKLSPITPTRGGMPRVVLGIIIAVALAIVMVVILVIIRYYRKAKREASLMRTDWRIGLNELRLIQLTTSRYGISERDIMQRTRSSHSVSSAMSNSSSQGAGSVLRRSSALHVNNKPENKSVSQTSLMFAATANIQQSITSRGSSATIPFVADVHSIGIAAYTTGQERIRVVLAKDSKFQQQSRDQNILREHATALSSYSSLVTVELFALSSQIASSLGFDSAANGTVPKPNITSTTARSASTGKKTHEHSAQLAHRNNSLTLPRTFILELRAMKDALHENVNLFVGICLERQPAPCFAMRYCPKGALQNLIITHTDEDDEDYDDDYDNFGASTMPLNGTMGGSSLRRSKHSLSTNTLTGGQSTKGVPRRNNGGLFLDDNIKTSFAQDICSGMRYLHTETSLGFHGRLRSNTILLDGRWTAKVSGFGMWKWKYDTPLESLQVEQPERLLWTSPELLRCADFIEEVDERTFQAADVWSMGVVLSEIIYQETPYAYLKMSPADIVTHMLASANKQSSNKLYGSKQPLGVNDGETASDEHKKLLLPQHAPLVSALPSIEAAADHQLGSTTAIMSEATVRTDQSSTVSAANAVHTLEALRQLMIQCWHENANLRPTFVTLARNLRAITRGRPINIVDAMIAKMESHTDNLEALVAARTADVREQQARADQLLSRMMPHAVAERLKAGLTVEPEYFDASTVFFSDIVKFTVLAARSTPFQVVHLLNSVYVFMDNVMAKYSVYKVETIGDAYMVVSGVPERIAQHAAEICSMALEIRGELARNVSIAHLPLPPVGSPDAQHSSLRIRIGINSGPTVAGVVGLAMPRYCLFGDTVNVASRMESHGLPDKIQLSASSWSELMDTTKTTTDLGEKEREQTYDVTPRGVVDIKGKGEMMTYWLLSGPTRSDGEHVDERLSPARKRKDETIQFVATEEDKQSTRSEQNLSKETSTV